MSKAQTNTLTKPRPPKVQQFQGVNSELLNYLVFITPDKPTAVSQLDLIIRIQGDSSHLGEALTARRRLKILVEKGATVTIILEAVTGIAGLIVGLAASSGRCLMHAGTIVSLAGIRLDYKREYTQVSLATLINAIKADLQSLISQRQEYAVLSNQAIAAGADPQKTAALFSRLLERGEQINLSPEALYEMGLVDAIFENEEELNAILQG